MMANLLLTSGKWSLELTEHGHFIALRFESVKLRSKPKNPKICELTFGRPARTLEVGVARLIASTPTSAQFETVLDLGRKVILRFTYELQDAGDEGTAALCRISLSPEQPLETDVHLKWFWNVRLRTAQTTIFAPLFDGRGLRTSRATDRAWHYRCAGGWGEADSERLALPVLDESSTGLRLHMAYFADPLFSTGITLPLGEEAKTFECEFLRGAGSGQFIERTFGLYLHMGDEETALNGFIRHGTPHNPPGPAWLHDIAMAGYDFLSENGEGWFRDIDRLTELVEADDHRRIAITLHGWYDYLGRYCYDAKARRLEERWTVMPRGEKRELSLSDLHRRLAYAKERGFRVLLYFADGMAIDSGAPNYEEGIIFREPDGSLRKHHWAGPDTVAQTYIMNPLHPAVQDFFREYTHALVTEFGDEIDGLIWDETFTIRVGDLSGGTHAGYADRAFMLLSQELREIIKAEHRDVAFLASDDTGLVLPREDGSSWSAEPAQNALVFDGTFQDSQCYPTAWQYGLFPNFRNVLWSCNWKPVENFEWTVLGVKAFGAPVAISNGYSENKGVSRYSAQELERLMRLFEYRKAMRSRVRWIECREEPADDWKPTLDLPPAGGS